MNFDLKENKLTLYFEGSLNSANVDQVKDEIDGLLKGKTFSSLVLDFNNLEYISSAGLRLVLKLKQTYNDVCIEGASLEVYDTLQMTGFTDILSVKKRIRQISVKGAEVIGSGYFSTVYRIDKDTIIKVFNRVSDPQQIQRELSLAKEAFILGIPTAISFDIVQVDDGKLGVRFEMLDCISLKDIFTDHPDEIPEYTEKYVNLLKKINTTECTNPIIPDRKKSYIEKVKTLKPYLDSKYYEKAMKMIEEIPDRKTFIHGDCHFKNIMIQNGELLLIDMDTLSVGHPIFELAGLYCPYCAFNEDEPGNSLKFFGISDETGIKLFHTIIEKYFGKFDEVILDKIRIVAYIHMMWWSYMNEPEKLFRLEGCRPRLIKLLDKYNDVLI